MSNLKVFSAVLCAFSAHSAFKAISTQASHVIEKGGLPVKLGRTALFLEEPTYLGVINAPGS